MTYALRENLSYALVSRWTVFLDVSADRYVCLDRQAGQALAKIASDKVLQTQDHVALKPLTTAGLLLSGGSGNAVPRPVSIDATSSLSEASCEPVRLPDVIGAFLAMTRQRNAGRTCSIRDAIGNLDRRKLTLCKTGPNDHRTAIRVATAFDRASLIVGAHDLCLPRSFALARLLAARGIACDLVFGVAMDPFAAHCWVQHDGVVLNDHLDHVRTFTPILVV